MCWVWSLGGLPVRELAAKVLHKTVQDNILGQAAQLSYFFFLSLFSLMIFGAAVVGVIRGSDLSLYNDLLVYLSGIMPASAFEIVRDALNDMTTKAGAGNIYLGIGLTLWAGSAGMWLY
jgi:membrane protein